MERVEYTPLSLSHPHLLVIYRYDRCGPDLASLAFSAPSGFTKCLAVVKSSRLPPLIRGKFSVFVKI